jgi:poly(hydroxyalkanoate) granule-associated protein
MRPRPPSSPPLFPSPAMAETPKRKVTIVTKKRSAPDEAPQAETAPPPGARKKGSDKGGLLDLQRLLDFPAGLAENAREVWMAGIGALSTVEEAGQAVFDELVKKGEHWERESRQKLLGAKAQAGSAAGKAVAAAQDLGKKPGQLAAEAEAQIQRMVEDTVEGVLHRLGVPTHEEVRDLIHRVESLSGKVDTLTARLQTASEAASEAASPPAPRKAPVKAAPSKATPSKGAAAKASPVKAEGAPTGGTVYHVAPGEEGWAVQREGTSRATSRHGTKADALSAGRELAKQHAPSRLVVYRQDGTVQNEFTYET